MAFRAPGRVMRLVVVVGALLVSACGGAFAPKYEYEEELYLALDGTATLNVNASVPALVALRGAALPLNPRARLDRGLVRAFFEGPGVTVTRVSLSRRQGRRFVHVGLVVRDVRRLTQVAPFAWSRYRFTRLGDVMAFTQAVGAPAGTVASDIGWGGTERVVFKIHVPSRIPFHNSQKTVLRGNILEWEQTLADRLAGRPLQLEVHMEPKSILYSTLLLFAGTIVAAALTFGVVIWWVVRRGRGAEVVESRS